MLRNDGKYEIYVIEFRPKTLTPQWARISFDVAWVPQELYISKKEVWDEFSSSGKCWQETGVHGTYNVETAIRLYVMLKEHGFKKDAYQFRVTKLTISQNSEVLWGG